MKLTPKMQKGGAMVIVGLVGIATGQWLPPDVIAQILGVFT